LAHKSVITSLAAEATFEQEVLIRLGVSTTDVIGDYSITGIIDRVTTDKTDNIRADLVAILPHNLKPRSRCTRAGTVAHIATTGLLHQLW
jgi:hypothetical protein